MKRFGCTDEVPGVQKKMEEIPPFTCQETATSEAWFLRQIKCHCLKIITHVIQALLKAYFKKNNEKMLVSLLIGHDNVQELTKQVSVVSYKGIYIACLKPMFLTVSHSIMFCIAFIFGHQMAANQ